MLKIRPEQMEVLRQYMRQRFEDKMVLHLKEQYPSLLENSTEDELRKMVREGMEKAPGYGVEDRDDIQRYLECMAEYGRDFDTNPKTAWAGEILNRKDLKGTEKMVQILDQGMFLATHRVAAGEE